MGPEQEVPEVDEFAVGLVLDVDDAPPVLAAPDLLAVDDDRLLRSNDSEGNEVLLATVSRVASIKLVRVEKLTLISAFIARSSSSNSSVSYGYIFRL